MDYPSQLTATDRDFLNRLYAPDMARLAALCGFTYGQDDAGGATILSGYRGKT